MNNYRGITISSVISKVLELALLDRIESLLVTKEQQFGCKRKHSCADCSFVLRSAVDYYLKRGNDKVFVCALDLSKTYDRVPYYNLFVTLLEMGVPVYFVRLLSVWYEKQPMHVKWKTQLSEKFTVGNGVRQGSVLSPSFFNIYIEDLLIRLKNRGYAARVGSAFVGCLALC